MSSYESKTKFKEHLQPHRHPPPHHHHHPQHHEMRYLHDQQQRYDEHRATTPTPTTRTKRTTTTTPTTFATFESSPSPPSPRVSHGFGGGIVPDNEIDLGDYRGPPASYHYPARPTPQQSAVFGGPRGVGGVGAVGPYALQQGGAAVDPYALQQQQSHQYVQQQQIHGDLRSMTSTPDSEIVNINARHIAQQQQQRYPHSSPGRPPSTTSEPEIRKMIGPYAYHHYPHRQRSSPTLIRNRNSPAPRAQSTTPDQEIAGAARQLPHLQQYPIGQPSRDSPERRSRSPEPPVAGDAMRNMMGPQYHLSQYQHSQDQQYRASPGMRNLSPGSQKSKPSPTPQRASPAQDHRYSPRHHDRNSPRSRRRSVTPEHGMVGYPYSQPNARPGSRSSRSRTPDRGRDSMTMEDVLRHLVDHDAPPHELGEYNPNKDEDTQEDFDDGGEGNPSPDIYEQTGGDHDVYMQSPEGTGNYYDNDEFDAAEEDRQTVGGDGPESGGGVEIGSLDGNDDLVKLPYKWLICVYLVAAVGLVLGVVFGLRGGQDVSDPTTAPASVFFSGGSSVAPFPSPSIARASSSPSLVSSLVPSATIQPTAAPIMLGEVLRNDKELREAVRQYIEDGTNTSDVARRYGWPIGTWDVSRIKSFDRLFAFDDPLLALFNDNIYGWNTSGVTTMAHTFDGAVAFDQDLSNWDTSNVVTMNSMFAGATSFNQNLNGWDVSRVTDLSSMFRHATSFDGNVSTWHVASATSMTQMFLGASSFNGDLSSWRVSSSANMTGLFEDAIAFDTDLSDWDVSSVNSMRSMFKNATAFGQNLLSWDVSRVTDMSEMFMNARSFASDLHAWDVSGVVTFDSMFLGATSFNHDLCDWGLRKNNTRESTVVDMFLDSGCEKQDDPEIDFSPPAGPWCVTCRHNELLP